METKNEINCSQKQVELTARIINEICRVSPTDKRVTISPVEVSIRSDLENGYVFDGFKTSVLAFTKETLFVNIFRPENDEKVVKNGVAVRYNIPSLYLTEDSLKRILETVSLMN